MTTTVRVRTPPSFTLMMCADWYCALDEDDRWHAVENITIVRWAVANEDALQPIENEPLLTACGQKVPVKWWPDDELARAICLGWPARVSSLTRIGHTRCSDCWNLTGRKRPHKDWPA